MVSQKHTRLFVLLTCWMLLASQVVWAQTYFVDAVNGNDSLDGLSQGTAWKTLQKVNTQLFGAGDTILLKRGCLWNNSQLLPQGSGLLGRPILVSSYGEGAIPVINGGAKYLTTVLLYNQQYWEVENLELTNHSATDSTSTRYGVYVLGYNIGAVKHIFLRNLIVHDVNGNRGSKTCGGIFFEVTGLMTPTWFDSLIVEGCDIFDVSPVGIASNSSWSSRTLTTNTNWYPSVNIFLKDNSIRRTVRNGMIVRVCRGAVVEHNLFQECAKDSSGNAVFAFNCDSTVMQYNEATLTRFNPNDDDAGGFDADYRCKKTIIQYNYSHDNEYGGIVVVSDASGNSTFNDSTVVRYNVLRNNQNHAIRISGNVTNTSIYNNTVYSSYGTGAVIVVWHKSWGGYCANTQYSNNIFEIQRLGSSFQLGGSTNTLFDYNLFHGVHTAGEPADQHKIFADPLFKAPDSVGDGWETASGLQLQSSSPAINSGISLPGHSVKDYLGNPVPSDSLVDRGAFEYQVPMGVADRDERVAAMPSLKCAYPNPFNPSTKIRFELRKEEQVLLSIYDILGRHIATLLDERLAQGLHEVTFSAGNLAGGVYFYTLRAGSFASTRSLLLLK